MTWIQPRSESEWEEILSAYLDGELSEGEMAEVPRILRTDPARKKQLEDLREASAHLKRWHVSVPSPSPEFLERIATAERGERDHIGGTASRRIGWFGWPRILQPAGPFAIGILVGILGTLATQRFPSLQDSTERVWTGKTARNEPAFSGIPSVSKEQGENLLREVAAGRLVSRIMAHVKEGKWSEALSAYRVLRQDYPNTLALNQIDRDYAKVLSRAIPMTERSL